MSLITEFIEKGVIDNSQSISIQNSMDEGESLDKILITDLNIEPQKVMEIKKNYFSDIDVFEADESFMVPDEILNNIPLESARRYNMVPINISEEGYFEVGMLNPENMIAKTTLQFISTSIGYPYRIRLISFETYENIIGLYSGSKSEVSRALGQYGIDAEQEKKLTGNDVTEAIIKDDGPIAKIVKNIIKHAAKEGASDVHIEVHEKEIVVRYRIDGIMISDLTLPSNISNAIVARIKILSRMKIDEKRKPQDGRFSGVFEGRKIDFRVSTFPTFYGEKVVMRLLEQDRGALPLEQIGLSSENLEAIDKIIHNSFGIILVCGPTGSGKTNTLYSLLNEIDKTKKNVVSLENPIELNVPGVSQSQVHPQIGYTFATGLRSILRQDPDVIMVGEIRDEETAKLAIEAALTGHLVLSTIHTNTASDVPQRLIDMGVEPYLIGPSLIAAIGQRLIRKIIPEQKKEVPMSDLVKTFIEKNIATLPESRKGLFAGDSMFEPIPNEDNNGFKGRTAVFEILEVTKDIQRIILTDPSSLAIFETARKDGFITFKEDAILKALDGVTSFEEVMQL
ncbi:MAG TPA: type II/IV secretion system protein [Candidatus Pacebacteria bacterium]|nr:type II/IV secretion system protein [Candidatus Paceibacterota bacterium]